MNLYLLTQTDRLGYDTYDACVVVAPDEDTARCMHPGGYDPPWDIDMLGGLGKWAFYPSTVKVQLIGVAVDGTAQGVICASFNAG